MTEDAAKGVVGLKVLKSPRKGISKMDFGINSFSLLILFSSGTKPDDVLEEASPLPNYTLVYRLKT